MIPDLVIFHAPDRLEFAAAGKTLDVIQIATAATLFAEIRKAPKSARGELIGALFASLVARASAGCATGAQNQEGQA